MNLNLVRNHIISYKRKIEETTAPDEFPEIYHRSLPPEIEQGYMARADEIRENAKVSLARYRADPDYQYLCSRIDTLPPKDVKDTSIGNVIGYAQVLENAINKDDLITMRRHENAENYLSSFISCAQKVKSLKPPENEQISFFYSYDDEPEFEDDEDELEM